MFDEIFDVFERDRRDHGHKPRRGLRGLLARLTGDDHDDRHRDSERRRYRDDDRYDRDDEDEYEGRRRRRDRDRFDIDD